MSEKIIKVPKPTHGRRFAIGDIHGCFNTLRTLVENHVQLMKEDQLFLLGDYIDRGPSSSGVINYITTLQKSGYQVFTIIGNHEQMLLDDVGRYNPKVLTRWMKLNKTLDLLDQETKQIQPQYIDFFNNSVLCIELDNCYLVHAGFNFSNPSILEDEYAMVWTRKMEIKPEKLHGKFFVHGHTPHPIEEIRDRIAERNIEIILDNGCVYKDRPRQHTNDGELGRLCALNLDTFELFEQEYCG